MLNVIIIRIKDIAAFKFVDYTVMKCTVKISIAVGIFFLGTTELSAGNRAHGSVSGVRLTHIGAPAMCGTKRIVTRKRLIILEVTQ